MFLDGVRQAIGVDYAYLPPTSIDFGTFIGLGVNVFTRTLISTVLDDPAIIQNSQCTTTTFTNDTDTDLNVGVAGIDPACTMVFKNGSLLTGGGVDYVVSAADTTISAITKIAATTAQATVPAQHFATTGAELTIAGCAEPEFNGTHTITVTSAFAFTYPVLASAPASATQASPSVPISFSPPQVNDKVILAVAPIVSDVLVVMTFQRISTAPSTGEANTASNLGAGVGLFSVKTGDDLRFKSIAGGSGVLVTDAGGGTISITGDASQTFESRVGINTSVYNMGLTDSYIGVRDTSSVVTVDVSTVPLGTSGSGRRVGENRWRRRGKTHTPRLF